MSGVGAGERSPKTWLTEADDWDFFAAKGVVDTALGRLGVGPADYEPGKGMPFHPTRVARVRLGDVSIGVIGAVHPDVIGAFDFPTGTDAVAFELALEPVLAVLPGRPEVDDLPRFPPVYVDLAIVVDESVPAAMVESLLRRAGAPEVRSVRLFDVYRGEQVRAGKKSLAYALEMRAPDRTLTDEDANVVRSRPHGRVGREDRCGVEVLMAERDFLSIADVTTKELVHLLDEADRAKARPGTWKSKIEGKQVALIFEKPSTRTRVSFEVAVTSMGGHALVLKSDELQLGRGETIEDTGRVLAGYVDALVVRTFEQERLERLAASSSVPVINALSDRSHPCQALSDMQTIREKKGGFEGLALAYVGDGNNMAHSLLLAGSKLGLDVRVATPAGYEPQSDIVSMSEQNAIDSGGSVTVTEIVAEAVSGADVLYTDVWTSMGQESESVTRADVFERFQLNSDLVDLADDEVIVMHCLPAHRGEEISRNVMDGPHSVVWDQAENRLHSQKALLAWLLG